MLMTDSILNLWGTTSLTGMFFHIGFKVFCHHINRWNFRIDTGGVEMFFDQLLTFSPAAEMSNCSSRYRFLAPRQILPNNRKSCGNGFAAGLGSTISICCEKLRKSISNCCLFPSLRHGYSCLSQSDPILWSVVDAVYTLLSVWGFHLRYWPMPPWHLLEVKTSNASLR